MKVTVPEASAMSAALKTGPKAQDSGVQRRRKATDALYHPRKDRHESHESWLPGSTVNLVSD